QTKEELGQEFNLSEDQMQSDTLRVTSVSPKELLAQLEEQGFKQLAVCGGSSIYQQFLEAGIVDELILTVEPALFGQGVNLFKKPLQKKLKLIESKQINNQGTLLCTYECKN
ncbi:MAG: dihydrofolate reductase family protein, partial [Patescibacteria group bacterium]|nr:dihydrofolate reductase family protein [Patescibacteria group bacterium]